MKEFIGQIMQKLGAYFLPKSVKQAEVKMEQANGSTRKLQRFLAERFDFRHNQLTGVTEYRPKDGSTAFRPIDEREMNGMIVDARLKGIACWNSMIPTLVLSNKVESYNPFHLYMEELPEWDGIDRVTPLLARVSDDELWLKSARCWMRAMTAQCCPPWYLRQATELPPHRHGIQASTHRSWQFLSCGPSECRIARNFSRERQYNHQIVRESEFPDELKVITI